MAVDLGDLVEAFTAQVNPPGTDLYPNAVEDDWIQRLANAFWMARLEGVTALSSYTVNEDFQVEPLTVGDDDIDGELQQLIVLYGAFMVTVTALQNARAKFRAQAGPVEFETQQAATQLRDVLSTIKERLNLILRRLGDLGTTDTAVLDAVIERNWSQAVGDSWWVRS